LEAELSEAKDIIAQVSASNSGSSGARASVKSTYPRNRSSAGWHFAAALGLALIAYGVFNMGTQTVNEDSYSEPYTRSDKPDFKYRWGYPL